MDISSNFRQRERVISFTTRFFVWAALLGVLYILRSFFLLIFLTFVFAYIQSGAVERFGRWIGNRALRAVIVGLLFLAFIVGVASFIVPSFVEEAKVFAGNYPLYMRSLDKEIAALAERHPLLKTYLPDTSGSLHQSWSLETSFSAQMVQELAGYEEGQGVADNLKHALDTMKGLGAGVVSIISAFFLSLLFSFLIVLDLPRLTKSVEELANTKVGFIYAEVAHSIYSFCKVLGKALEAQFFIALANTALTALGLLLIGITEKMALLSTIVFFCSFIPIAGVFISSVPICLVALQISGFGLMLLAIMLITVVHLIEAYVLNPRIFGHHLRVNPVLVLIVLTVFGKLFGVWGLVLGLPVCTYVFRTAIRYGHNGDSAAAGPA